MAAGTRRDPHRLDRRLTREVRVGEVGIGGTNPIRLQSMTTTDTLDTIATVDQCERLVNAGCEILRITAPSLNEARNLSEIARVLRARGVHAPLVADIHFTPRAALVAAEHVEKVRINPGNFADKKKFAVREYTDAEYSREIDRVSARFRPLVQRCKALGRALRIGTNHGSLSDRIMNRFGDTPVGMIESALEFLDVCEDEVFRDVVFSMKASNPQIAIQAYRLLAARLEARAPGEPSYPFHVGVTEAGDGEDGRIKSAIGIGSLLEDGIGDTIRVSLTEAPEMEIPVAAALARRGEGRWREVVGPGEDPGPPFPGDSYTHQRRATRSVGPAGFEIGADHPVRVELELGSVPGQARPRAEAIAASLAGLGEIVCEGLLVEVLDPGDLDALAPFAGALVEAGVELPLAVRVEACFADACAGIASRLVVPVGVLVSDDELATTAECAARAGTPVEWEFRGREFEIAGLIDRALAASSGAGLEEILVSVDTPSSVRGTRIAAARLGASGAADVPIVLRHRRGKIDDSEALVVAAVDLGALLCDGIGDAIALVGVGDARRCIDLAYRILQGARRRTSRTEFISCPSCGRTLFDLEKTTARIKARTGHLRGVKIAVMGCIVNGPGEMADADFGYVGSGPGQVDLYVGRECVARKVSDASADDRLVAIIREHGRWTEPS